MPERKVKPDDHVEPLLDDLAVDAGELDQQEGQDAAHDQLPHALDPEVHDPPAPVGVLGLVGGVDHARAGRAAPPTGGRRRAPATVVVVRRPFQMVMPMLAMKSSTFDDDQVVERPRDLEELAALPPPDVEAGDGRSRRRSTSDTSCTYGEPRPVQLAVALLGHDEVGGAHEARRAATPRADCCGWRARR